MGLYGVVLKKTALDIDERQLLAELFPQPFVQIPTSAFDPFGPYRKFESEESCINVTVTTNYIYLFSLSLKKIIDIGNQSFPDVFRGELTPVFVFDTEDPEFFLKDNVDVIHSCSTAIESLDFLNLSKRFEYIEIREQESGATIYCLPDYERYICLSRIGLEREIIFDILSERFEYNSVSDNNCSNSNYYILYEGDLNKIDLDYFTGKVSKFSIENEFDQWKKDNTTNLNIALEVWRSITENAQGQSIGNYIKAMINLFISLFMLLFLELFGGYEYFAQQRRFRVKLSIVVYSIFLLIGMILICLMPNLESWKDITKVFIFLVFGIALSRRFIKIILLKK